MNRTLDPGYRDWIAEQTRAGAPVTSAATVIILRDHEGVLEVLMLRRGAEAEFVGGMWVFPGGKIDPEDHEGTGGDLIAAARNAAVRESMEEASQSVDPESMVWFSHWVPPQGAKFRFATFFFACRALHHSVTIDDFEIQDHAWLRPGDALARHRARDIQLAPPTFVTLTYLARAGSVDEALDAYRVREPRFYETQIAKTDQGMTFVWRPDAAYETKRLDTPGARHRAVVTKAGWLFDDSGWPW